MSSKCKSAAHCGGVFMSFGIAACSAAIIGATAFADPVDWSAYDRSFKIAFPGYAGTTTLEDFPVLIRLSAELNDFDYSKCKVADGGDLRFSDSDGNLLASEVDTWNPDGESLVWVRVPSLNASTQIRAYYGSDNPVAVDPKDVWSNGYLGVWHLNEDSSPLADSASSGLPFKRSSGHASLVDLGQSGVIGNAAAFDVVTEGDDAHKGYLTCDDKQMVLTGMKQMTIEMWIFEREWIGCRRLLYRKGGNDRALDFLLNAAKSDGTQSLAFYIGTTNIEEEVAQADIGPSYSFKKDDAVGKWRHVAVTYDSVGEKKARGFANGASTGSKAVTNDYVILPKGTDIKLGNLGGDQAFPGNVDEMRISSVARSTDWMKATYDTVHDVYFADFEQDNDWTKYAYKATIEFPGAPETALTDFPVLVKLAEYDEVTGTGIAGFRYANFAKPDGGDLRFSDENGQMLSHEIDTWNEGGTTYVWVKVPSLISNTNSEQKVTTKITAYYGWKFAPAVNSRDVWSNGYVGVWHLNEDARPLLNSTPTVGIDFTRTEDSSSKAGLYDECIAFATNGTVGAAVGFGTNFGGDSSKDNKGGLIAYDPDGKLCGLDAMTIEIWAKVDAFDTTTTRYMLSRRMGNYVSGVKLKAYDFKYSSSKQPIVKFYYDDGNVNNDNGACEIKPSSAMPDSLAGQWNYHCGCYDKFVTSQTNYLNGAVAKTATSAGGYSIPAVPDPLCLGNDCKPGTLNDANKPSVFKGALDELRISSVARSAAWVKATHDTIADNGVFTRYGAFRENIKGFSLMLR